MEPESIPVKRNQFLIQAESIPDSSEAESGFDSVSAGVEFGCDCARNKAIEIRFGSKPIQLGVKPESVPVKRNQGQVCGEGAPRSRSVFEAEEDRGHSESWKGVPVLNAWKHDHEGGMALSEPR